MIHTLNNKGVCRTLPATPGLLLLNKQHIHVEPSYHSFSSLKNILEFCNQLLLNVLPKTYCRHHNAQGSSGFVKEAFTKTRCLHHPFGKSTPLQTPHLTLPYRMIMQGYMTKSFKSAQTFQVNAPIQDDKGGIWVILAVRAICRRDNTQGGDLKTIWKEVIFKPPPRGVKIWNFYQKWLPVIDYCLKKFQLKNLPLLLFSVQKTLYL